MMNSVPVRILATFVTGFSFFLCGESNAFAELQRSNPYSADEIRELTIASEEQIASARENYKKYDLSLDEEREVYRALFRLGFTKEELDIPDFLLRINTIRAVSAYQKSIEAAATGYLRKYQINLLRKSGKGLLPWEQKRQVGLKAVQDVSSGGRSNNRAAWEELGVSLDDRKRLYRALYALGHAEAPELVTEFESSLYAIAAISAYQRSIGAQPKGYLSAEQVDALLEIEADPVPSEQQAAAYEKYGKRVLVTYFSDLGKQQNIGDHGLKYVVRQLQKQFSMPHHGYITEAFFERSKEINLKPNYGEMTPVTNKLNPQELDAVKDWRRWETEDAELCEIGTAAIHTEGFIGSAAVPSISFFREADWPKQSINAHLNLVNWDQETIARIKVGAKRFYVVWDVLDMDFVNKDGSKLSSSRSKYVAFVTALMKANSFEVTYQTVFGNELFVNLSALGLTKQIRALQKHC